MPKLRTLSSSLKAPAGRLAMPAPARPGVVERKRGSAGVKDRERIRERDGGLCQECKRQGRTSVGTVVDHVRPLWAGGPDDDDNKELLCQTPCHDAKTAREARQRAAGGLIES